MKKQALGILVALTLTAAAAQAQTATTLSGKIVDLASYVTHDHNMESTKMGHATGDAMKGGDAMMKSSCPASLGLVTSAGRVYLLASRTGSAQEQDLCRQLGKTATVSGSIFSLGGMTALLVK